MASTRNLSFRSNNLGDNVKLVLCFVPPGAETFTKQFPLAWKTTTLAAKGVSVLDATWTSQLAFCASQVGGGSTATAGNYIPIQTGQGTSLELDKTASPPVFHFTTPQSLGGVSANVQATNNTGTNTAIGLGFITGEGDYERMNNVIVWQNVGNGTAVNGQFTPILSAYVAVDYNEAQILKADIQNTKPVWSENLWSLGQETTVAIKRYPNGTYYAVQLAANVADDEMDAVPMWKTIDPSLLAGKRVFEATLSFDSPGVVALGLQNIASQLLPSGYAVKLVTKAGNAEAQLSLELPFGTSCNQAEKTILGIVEGTGFPGRAAIKERGGELAVCLAGSFSYWTEISPASYDWYASGKSCGAAESESKAAQEVLNGISAIAVANEPDSNGDAAADGQKYLTANGNGTAVNGGGLKYSPALRIVDLPMAVSPSPQISDSPVDYGKTRVLGRKLSTLNLAA